MAFSTLPSADYLWKLFHYDPDTGSLTWKQRETADFKTIYAYRAHLLRVGTEAGSKSPRNPKQVLVNGRLWLAHRLIFKMMTGRDTELVIDHANGNPRDNRWSNLREATRSQNAQNSKRRKTNSLDAKGIAPKRMARGMAYQVTVNGRYIGIYDSLHDAKIARDVAAKILHGDFFRSS